MTSVMRKDGKQSPSDVLCDLVRTVTRAFYDDEAYVLMEALLRTPVNSAEDLALELHLHLKQVRKKLEELKDQHMICSRHYQKKVKDEAYKERGMREVREAHRISYYIDFKSFVDMVKYRFYQMQKELDRRVDDALNTKGTMECTRCPKRVFSPLDVHSIVMKTHACKCDKCGADLKPVGGATLQELTDLRALFQRQMSPVVSLLKMTDDILIPEIRRNYSSAALTTLELKEALASNRPLPYTLSMGSMASAEPKSAFTDMAVLKDEPAKTAAPALQGFSVDQQQGVVVNFKSDGYDSVPQRPSPLVMTELPVAMTTVSASRPPIGAPRSDPIPIASSRNAPDVVMSASAAFSPGTPSMKRIRTEEVIDGIERFEMDAVVDDDKPIDVDGGGGDDLFQYDENDVEFEDAM